MSDRESGNQYLTVKTRLVDTNSTVMDTKKLHIFDNKS